MENKPDIVDELERINKLTPDQAYQESVAEIGRAPSITDAQDAAARVPQAQIDAMKEKVAPPAAPAAPASPAAPSRQQQPQQPQTVIGRDGKGRTTFGGYVRVVDQKTGATTWEDLKGNAVEAPQSLRMMEAASSGISPNQGTATSWADAIEQQKAARLAEAKTRGQQSYDFMLKSQKEREMQRAERNFTTAQAAKNALRLLMQEGLGDIKEHNGKKYRVVSVGGSSIERANAQSEAMGRKSSLSKIAAYVQVDDNGKPIADPAFYMSVNKSDGSKASKSLIPLDLGRVMNQFSTSFATLNNVSEADARASTVSEFGGLNPFKWQVGANTPASVQAAQVRAEGAKEVQELKNKGNLEVAQVAPKGGGKSEAELKIEQDKLEIRRQELQARIDRGEKSQQLKEDIFAYQLAQDGHKEAAQVFSGLPAEKKAQFQQEYLDSIESLKKKYAGGQAQPGTDKGEIKSGDNGGWKDGVEYTDGMNVPVGGSVTRKGKTYYMWSDGNFHSTKEATK